MWKDLNSDFRSLIGGRQFLVNIELGRNGAFIKSIAHIDGGANIFGAIRTSIALRIRNLFGVSFLTLPKPIVPTGYNGNSGSPITKVVLLTLTINKRRINFPFLITDLGSTDVLIGRKFLEHYDLKQSYAKGKNLLEWPLDMPPQKLYFDRRLQMLLPPSTPTPLDAQHQADVARRDQLFDGEEANPPIGQIGSLDQAVRTAPTTPAPTTSRSLRPPTFVRELKRGLQNMNKLLANQHRSNSPFFKESPPVLTKQAPKKPYVYKTEINLISASSMHRFFLNPRKRAVAYADSKDKGDVLITSFKELDDEVQRREAIQEALTVEVSALEGGLTPEEVLEAKYQENDNLVQTKLPSQYKEYKALFSSRSSDNLAKRRPTVDHVIELTGTNNLTFEPLRRMTDEQLSAAKRYITENLHKGFIAPSNAPFAAPILMARKPGGGLRFCVDFRKLNELTKKDPYPIPLIDEMMARISQAKIFSKLDIQQAFHRIRIDKESEDYTTFRTRYGTYKYKVLPFGLTNGPATFQRFINDILMEHLDDFCSAYLDDILIYSDSQAEHEIHVKRIMQILKDHGLQADIKKSEFSVEKTKFLGFIIGTAGIEVDPEKIEVIQNWEYAANIRGVQSYLGFCNFYRRFIKDYSRICRPLTKLTGKDVPFRFDDTCKEAWEALRTALRSAPVLCHYDPFRQTRLETDSSDGVVAGVLSQLQDDGFFHPTGFFSKTMIEAELNYPIHDKELLAIFRSFQQYKPELLGAQKVVHVYTDHRALEYFMTTKDLNPRQARWAEFFAEFHFTIMYRSGITNTLADTLSRRDQDLTPQEAKKRSLRSQQMIPNNKIDPKILQDLDTTVVGSVSLKELDEFDDLDSYISVDISPLEAQEEELGEDFIVGEAPDPVSMVAYDIDGYNIVDEVIAANKTSPLLEPLRDKARQQHMDYELKQDKLFFQGRLEVPLEPAELRTTLIRHVHAQPQVAHAGISKVKLLLSRKYHWNGLTTDVGRFISNCACARKKVRRDKTPGLLHPLPIPARPYQHLTMDFTELPIDENGYDFAFVIMDRLTKKSVSVPCHKTITAKQMAELFITHWFRHFGMPDSIVSDRGPQFISTLWREFCRILGTKVKLTTAYNPNVDGQTEIMNQYIKQRLRPFCTYYQDNWSSLLPIMDVAQLTLPHESLGNISPFQLLNGYEPRTSWDIVNPTPPSSATEKLNREEAVQIAERIKNVIQFAQTSLRSQQGKMERLANRSRREVDWDVGDMVMVSTANWKMDRPSRKLSDKWYGPVKVLDKIGESWKLELPSNWKIYPVFHSHSLRRFVADPLPGQVQEPPAAIQLLPEQDEWEIEEVLGAKLLNRKLHYQIKWKGADEDLEWYPCSDAMTAPHLLKRFHLRYRDAIGPPRSLPQWLEAYNAGVEDYRELEDDRPMTQTARSQFFGREG